LKEKHPQKFADHLNSKFGCKICFWQKNQGLVFWQNWDCKQVPGHICFCLFVFNLFLCVCVCMFFFLSFWFLFIADVLLLFEVVVSQRRIVLFVNLVWELRRGGGGCLDPWKCRSRKKKKEGWDGDEGDV